MAKISVCIESLFKEYPFLERIDRVSKLGLPGFEFWGWKDKDISAIAERAQMCNLDVVTLIGPSGSLMNRRERKRVLKSLEEAIKVAHKLGCSTLIVMAGSRHTSVSRDEQRWNLIEGLKEASRIVEREGIVLVLEVLNTLVDHPGYFLDSSKEGFEILYEVESPNVKLLYDIYHMQIMEGNLIRTIEENIHLIGHFHTADVPGRHEPGTGEINYSAIIRRLDELDYSGYVGLEHVPSMPSEESIRRTLSNFLGERYESP